MRYFSDIERFLERDIHKNALPEGLGEGPEYRPSAPRKSTRGRGGRSRGGRSNGGTSGNGGNGGNKHKKRNHRGGKNKNTQPKA